MNLKRIAMTAFFVLAVGGAFAQETVQQPEAEAEPVAAPAWRDDIPITPKINWDELNWLQKCTAGIAYVPGCVLGVLANGCYWVYGCFDHAE